MKIHLLQTQREFLIDEVINGKETLLSTIEKASFCNGKYEVDISSDIADEIRDLCAEQLQRVGFDKEYELTSKGRELEELIDILLDKR